MNLGEKLRQLRQDRDLTQPELAEAMGIEQSYLSKLENGKYVPSSDVFSQLLDALDMQVGDLVDELDQSARNQLRQIPDVARHFDMQKGLMITNRRRWLLVSSLLLALGFSLIYAGYSHLFVGNLVYNYQSNGVIFEGEYEFIFVDSRYRESDEIIARTDIDLLITRTYRGDLFIAPVEGGSRLYELDNLFSVDPWQNKAVTAIGVFLAALGLTGILLDQKISRFS